MWFFPSSKAETTGSPILSAVVPCFNEAAGVKELYQRLSRVLDGVGLTAEIILVNDGSTDGTWMEIGRLAELDKRVMGVDLSRNHGHQLALTAGLTVSRGQRILIVDADLQDPPELLPEMLRLLEQGADVVYGRRRARVHETWFKRVTAGLFYRVLNYLSETEIPLDTGDFRLMSRRALNVVLAMPEQSRFIRGMVSWVGFRQVALEYDRAERFAGETKYPFRKMWRLALDAITGFSLRPLRLATYLGLITAAAAIVLGFYYFISWKLGGQVVPGWLSLMLVMLILGSAQMTISGILGEYIGRIYLESKRRPLFIIREILPPRAED